ncbi:unnamed protein product, partial [Iphiclides podalirius]
MYVSLIAYALLQQTGISADQSAIVSEEKHDFGRDRRQDTLDFDLHRSNRRFHEDLEGEQWHVAHLRDTKTGLGEPTCKGETFEQTARKYRRTLREDGSRVKFVLADPLPVDDEDINNYNEPCLTADGKAEGSGYNKNETKPFKNDATDEEALNATIIDGIVTKNPNTATTTANAALIPDANGQNAKAEETRRGGEYQFSSVEYYEDTVDFDTSQCPDEVEVIVLQIDQLRNYDVECEIMIEWRGLE